MTQKSRKQEQKSFFLKKEEVERNWFVLDAEGKTLGRFASEIAKVLRGKHKPIFTPSTDGGDGVIVINADKIVVTGAKEAQKIYVYHTGHVGGQREIPYRVMKARKPEYIIEHAVKGMMPRTKLGRKQMTRLRIFAGTEHHMQAQQPITANI
jgi:large subunit ribosomal protein L13